MLPDTAKMLSEKMEQFSLSPTHVEMPYQNSNSHHHSLCQYKGETVTIKTF
jgi:hypothetical protein